MSFLRKGILVSGGQVLGNALNMLAMVMFARALHPDGMGRFELFRSTQTIVLTLFAIGIGGSTIYFLNNVKIPPVRLVTCTFKASMVLGLLLTIGFSAVVLHFDHYFGHISAWAMIWFAVGSCFLLCMYWLRGVLVAQLAATRIFTVDLSIRVVLLVFGAALFVLGYLRLEAALAVVALGNMVACGLSVFYLREYIDLRQPFEWRLFGSMVSYGVKLASANLLIVLSANITVMLLRHLHGDFASVGLYTRAAAVASMVVLVPQAIGPMLYAKWAGLDDENRCRQGEMAARMNFALGSLACIGILIFARPLIYVLYGSQFMGSVFPMYILTPAAVLLAVSNVCDQMLASDGKAALTAMVLAGTLVIIGITSWIAIPIMGIQGAGLAVLCGNCFTLISSMLICSRLYGYRFWHSFILTRSDCKLIKGSLFGSGKRKSMKKAVM